MQIFVVGAPRSGTTIVAQTLNTHPQIKIFDEIGLIDVADFGALIIGKLMAFLVERGAYEMFREHARAGGDPADALRRTMAALAEPRPIWGEKNPLYATRLDELRRCFPAATILFVLRDPREVVNSYLAHRASLSRSHVDFWIKNCVADALALVESCVAPLKSGRSDLQLLRYEEFVADPKAALEAALRPQGVRFGEHLLAAEPVAPETAGDHQFFRRGAPLPWKLGNLQPIRSSTPAGARLDESDPAWARVDALAQTLGYS